MKKVSWFLPLIIIIMVGLTAFQKDKKPKPAFQRVVCFKFKTQATDADRDQHMKEFEAFVKQVPQALSYRAGKTVRGEQKTEPEFDVMHYITFEKEQDIITYDVHPAHQKFVEQNKGVWERVIVVNAKIIKD